jgi:hypothetical protein
MIKTYFMKNFFGILIVLAFVYLLIGFFASLIARTTYGYIHKKMPSPGYGLKLILFWPAALND